MNSRLLTAALFSLLVAAVQAESNKATSSLVPLGFPQKRAAVYEDVRRHQSLGRIVLAPDASFFIYEWSRPYDWVPDRRNLARKVGERKQTFMYKVLTPDEWERTDAPTSEELLPASPGATYYLGSLSPDAKRVFFYELDWDDKEIRAGVVPTAEDFPAKIIWFEPRPDDAKLDSQVVWLSNTELLYPIKGNSAKMARASLITEKAEPCTECALDKQAVAIGAKQLSSRTALHDGGSAKPPLPKAAKIVESSKDGKLSVYSVDTPDELTLLFVKNGRSVKLFENDRRIGAVTVSK